MSSTCPEIQHHHDARHAVGGALTAIGADEPVAGRRSRTSPAPPACRSRPSIAWSTGARACARRRSRGSRRRWRSSATAPIAAATRLARNQSFRFAFILPTGANSFMTQPRRAGAAHRRLARRPARLHRRPACRRVRSRCAGAARWSRSPPSYHGVATIALDHPRVRAAIDDLAARGVRGRDAGVRRAELAPHALCRHRQSGRRPHRRDADGALPARAQRHGRRHRGLAGAARPCRAAVRLPPDPVRRVSRASSRCRRVEGRDDSERTRTLTATLLARQPDLVGIYSVGAGNRGIAAALEESGRARDIVWIAHELTRAHARASCCAA